MEEYKIKQIIPVVKKEALVSLFGDSIEDYNICVSEITYWALIDGEDCGYGTDIMMPMTYGETYSSTHAIIEYCRENIIDKLDIVNGIPTEDELKKKYKKYIEHHFKRKSI